MAWETLTVTLLESGVNTQSKLCRVTGLTTQETIAIPHTLRHTPVWAQVIPAAYTVDADLTPPVTVVAPIEAGPKAYPTIWDQNGLGTMTYMTGGTPSAGTGTIMVTLSAPALGTTETVYFTLHLGRTHSRAR